MDDFMGHKFTGFGSGDYRIERPPIDPPPWLTSDEMERLRDLWRIIEEGMASASLVHQLSEDGVSEGLSVPIQVLESITDSLMIYNRALLDEVIRLGGEV